MKIKLFSYNQLDTLIHQLSGLTKLLCFLIMIFTVILTYDIRVLLFMLAFAIVCFRISKIPFDQVKLIFGYILVFLLFDFVLSFVFAPQYGVEVLGTRHEIFSFGGPFVLTWEELYYLSCKTMKYLCMFPVGFVFFFTTNPSEFASSLNHIGVSAKICTTVALTMRYFPDVSRDYTNISLAQQARGIDMSRKEKLGRRIKNVVALLAPLIFSTMDRVDAIANAMSLRGYGKAKKRTWYSFRALQRNDYLALAVCIVIFVISLSIRLFVTKSYFYNPFIGW